MDFLYFQASWRQTGLFFGIGDRRTADIAAFLLMLDDGTVEFVHQNIDGGVHILSIDRFDMQILARQMHIGFGFVLQLVYGEGKADGNQVARMAADAFQLAGNMLPNIFAYFKIQTGDFQVHHDSLMVKPLRRGGICLTDIETTLRPNDMQAYPNNNIIESNLLNYNKI